MKRTKKSSKSTGTNGTIKKTLLTLLLFGVMLMVIPGISLLTGGKNPAEEDIAETTAAEISATSAAIDVPQEDTEVIYKVLDITTNEVYDLPLREYLIGAVAAEIPATFQEETLKAQAVAAHTYAERRKLLCKTNPDPSLKGAYFSNDSKKYQAFFTDSQMREYFGEDYDAKLERISKCVDEVIDYVVMYNNEPIIAAFHSISSGTTESAANVWGYVVDYLVPVDSKADKTAPKYRQEYTFSPEELKDIFTKYDSAIVFPEDPQNWFSVAHKSSSNTVLKLKVGDKEFTGADIRSLLNLRSSAFEIFFENNVFTFTTFGYGHGVGLSQFGANSMALDGKTFEDILLHYYPNTVIETVE